MPLGQALSAPLDTQGVLGAGVGEGRPPETRAWAGEESRGASPPRCSSERWPRPPSTLPGRSLKRHRPAGLWQPPENPHGPRDCTGKGLGAALPSIRGPGMSRPPGTEGLLCVPSVADPLASLFIFFADPLEGENSAIWAVPREGIRAGRRPSKNHPPPPVRGRPSCSFIIPWGEIYFYCPF